MGNAVSSKLNRTSKRSQSTPSTSTQKHGCKRQCHVVSTQDQSKEDCDVSDDDISPMRARKPESIKGFGTDPNIKVLPLRPTGRPDEIKRDEIDEQTAVGLEDESDRSYSIEEESSDVIMTDEKTIENLQMQVQRLKKRLHEKDEVIRSLERQLSQMRHDKEFQVSGLKESVDKVIREKDSEIRRLRAMWSPNDSLPVDVLPVSMVNNVSKAANTLSPPELGTEKHNVRFGISAENRPSSSRNLLSKLNKDKKTPNQVEFIRKALKKNVFLKVLDANQVDQLINCMTQMSYSSGSNVVTEGEYGSHLFVIETGKVEVYHSKSGKSNEHVIDLKSGEIFGELAILYNCRRTASVRADTEVILWELDRKDFQSIVKQSGESKQNEYVRLLKTVKKLKVLPDNKLLRIADCLEESRFSKGDYILRQGDAGDTFYIIQEGKVKELIEKRKKKNYIEEFVCFLEQGQYFGESALLTEENRSANVIAESDSVTALMLDRQAFNSLVGSIADLAHDQRNFSSLDQLAIAPEDEEDEDDDEDVVDGVGEADSKSVTTRLSRSIAVKIKTTPLEKLKTIRVVGQGGFGCVKIVTIPGLPRHAFALKAIRKAKIIKTGQQQHILAEKNIMMDMRSPFIGKLHRTYKDELRVYLLMDAYLGGDVYGVLKNVGSLTEPVARFYSACVLEALEYLHLRGVIYRDLKPENLMLDHNGYVKLVDFGFAKRLRFGFKTYTFCGTPEYFAPEIIANKGHDFAADYWSYGVLIYELLTRITPFYANDDMTVYENILNGLDGVKFSRRISKHAEHLIRGLCKVEPRNRLGYQRGGIMDIRKQRWFQGFDWMGLKAQRIPPPFDPGITDPTDTKHFENVQEKPFDAKEDKRLIKEANLAWEESF